MKKEIHGRIAECLGRILENRDEFVGLINEGLAAVASALAETGSVIFPGTNDELFEETDLIVTYRIAEGKPGEGNLREAFVLGVSAYKAKPSKVTVLDIEDAKEEVVDFSDIERESIPVLLEFIDRYAE